MINQEAKQIIEKRKKKHIEDDTGIEMCRENLIDLLSNNAEETITFLEMCSKEDVLWISEVFEEIAYNLQSKDYIECLKRISLKYQELDLGKIVNVAEKMIL